MWPSNQDLHFHSNTRASPYPLCKIAILGKNRVRVLINMGSGARPLVILRLIHHVSPYRIVLDVTHRRIDMELVKYARKKSPLL